MRKWIFLLLCAAMLLHTAAAADGQAVHRAYLLGYPDGTVRPQEAVTREMLAQVLLRLSRYEPQEDAFFDVPRTRWSYRAVCVVTELGIMQAEKGYFHPTDAVFADELALVLSRMEDHACFADLRCEQEVQLPASDRPITRAQLAAVFNRLFGRTPQRAEDLMLGMPTFSDNADIGTQYYLDLQEASCTHTYERTKNGERWTGLG